MTRTFLRNHNRVLISGGSSGIGKSFIEVILKLSSNSNICNLSRTEPHDFHESPRLKHFPCDLSDADAIETVWPAVRDWLTDPAHGDGGILLINNSGFGSYGRFGENARGQLLNMIDLNIRGMVDLTHRVLPLMGQAGGTIINVASIAGRQPTPFMGVYGASKAFVIHWSLALQQEYKDDGIHILALCPGPTESRFFERAGFRDAPLKGWGHSAEAVVNMGLKAAARRRSVQVCGGFNRLMTAVGSKLPLTWQAALASMVMRRMRLNPYLSRKS